MISRTINILVPAADARTERGCVEDQPQQHPFVNALRLIEDDPAALQGARHFNRIRLIQENRCSESPHSDPERAD